MPETTLYRFALQISDVLFKNQIRPLHVHWLLGSDCTTICQMALASAGSSVQLYNCQLDGDSTCYTPSLMVSCHGVLVCDVQDVAQQLLPLVVPALLSAGGRYALVGHSLGCWTAYELLLALRRAGAHIDILHCTCRMLCIIKRNTADCLPATLNTDSATAAQRAHSNKAAVCQYGMIARVHDCRSARPSCGLFLSHAVAPHTV
jgi:hypothetical protein